MIKIDTLVSIGFNQRGMNTWEYRQSFHSGLYAADQSLQVVYDNNEGIDGIVMLDGITATMEDLYLALLKFVYQTGVEEGQALVYGDVQIDNKWLDCKNSEFE